MTHPVSPICPKLILLFMSFFLNSPTQIRVSVGRAGDANEDVTQVVEVLQNERLKWRWLSERLEHFVAQGTVLLFVSTKAAAEELATSLGTHTKFQASSRQVLSTSSTPCSHPCSHPCHILVTPLSHPCPNPCRILVTSLSQSLSRPCPILVPILVLVPSLSHPCPILVPFFRRRSLAVYHPSVSFVPPPPPHSCPLAHRHRLAFL